MAYDIREKVQCDLNTYDLILVVDSDDQRSIGGLMGRLLNSSAFRRSGKENFGSSG